MTNIEKIRNITIHDAKNNIGKRVVFDNSYNLMKNCGIITSFNQKYILVLYDGDKCSKATLPNHLYFEDEYKKQINKYLIEAGKLLQEDKNKNGYK